MGTRRVALRSIENSFSTRTRVARKDPVKSPVKKSQKKSSIAPIFCKSPRKSKRSSIYSLFDDEVPEELSTFFESSTVEDPKARNLRPAVQPPTTEIFPGDDIFRDVPWIGISSPTYSRKRKPPPVERDDVSELFESSSDTASEETEPVQRRSPQKRRKLTTEEPGFQEWVERTNAEFAECEKHDLTVEEI